MTDRAERSPAHDIPSSGRVEIGWSECDITPAGPVLIAGQFHARVSEGVMDPITATAMALDSGDDHAVMVSCDLVSISHALRDAVRQRVAEQAEGLKPEKVMLNGTHTHTAPEVRPPNVGCGHTSMGTGVELPVMPIEDYVDFAADQIADCVLGAWQERSGGAVGLRTGSRRRWT
jgi:hypothetical protein